MADCDVTIAVIGAGFSGICAAVQIKRKLGIAAQVFEATEDVGGTWLHNRYPGCACDIPSHLYSYSFDVKPDWSERYSSQAEILRYLQDISRKYGIYDHIQFNSEVVQIAWIESKQKWELRWRRQRDDKIQSSLYDYVFAGLGPLRVPNTPEQFETFEGKIIHTARWDPLVDFTNKRVAVIGNGPSAVQTIPALVQTASSLTSYQRTPSWCMARKQYRYSERLKTLFRLFPWILSLYQAFLFIKTETYYVLFGYPRSFIARYLRSLFIQHMVGRLEAQGRGELAHKLIPEYLPGCKRLTLSDEYLESLCRSNVTVERSAIREIRGRTIVCENGNETEFDILCLATGFNVQGFLGNLQIYGRNNQSLNDLWKNGYPETYKSINIHGFPNFFLLLGPASAFGHHSAVSVIESQVNFAIKTIKYMRKHQITSFEPKKEAQEKFVEGLRKAHQSTVWSSGCKSWYMDAKGQIVSLWPGTIISFMWALYRTSYTSDYICNRSTPK